MRARARGPLEESIVQERQAATRALLQRPLLNADGPDQDQFVLVRRHATWLREWFARNTGWILQVESEFCRLRKTATRFEDGTRPAREPRTDQPFTRRRYVLWCLALLALERSDRQTALGQLADDVLESIAADPELAAQGIEIDLAHRDHRRDLVQVLRLLVNLRVLVLVHGDESQYIESGRDVLYGIQRQRLAALLNVKRGPSTLTSETLTSETLGERLEQMVAEPIAESDEARNRSLRFRLTRVLLEDPVLYYADLAESERLYLNSARATILGEIGLATGLVPEVRAEGIAMVDESGNLSDVGMPEEGTDGHFCLLLAEHLAAALGDAANEILAEDPWVGLAALETFTCDCIREQGAYWRKGVQEPGAERTLLARALERLEALRLVRREGDGVTPLAAIARFALGAPEAPPTVERLPSTGSRPLDREARR